MIEIIIENGFIYVCKRRKLINKLIWPFIAKSQVKEHIIYNVYILNVYKQIRNKNNTSLWNLNNTIYEFY